MRIERLRIPAFGPLRDIDTGTEPIGDFVVLVGPNEAGKSSLLEAIRTLLYGLHPATREAHPAAPWDGSEASVRGLIRTRDGRLIDVHRRMLATPWGRLHALDPDGSDREESAPERDPSGRDEVARGAAGVGENIRNSPVPAVAHVLRRIYEQVHAIALPEITTLRDSGRDDAWKLIRDHIMAGMGTRDLLPPREVAEMLEEEGKALWRPNRQGKSRDRELDERLRTRSRALTEAKAADAGFREAREAFDAGEDALSKLRNERAALREKVERAREYAPLAARLRYLEELARIAGDLAELNAVPSAPKARREALIEKLKDEERLVDEARSRLDDAAKRVPESEPSVDAILAVGDDIDALRVEVAGADDAARRALTLRAEAAAAAEALSETLSPLLEVDATPELEERLRAVPIEELRSRLARRSEARIRKTEAEERLALHRARPSPEPPTTTSPKVLRLLLVGAVIVLLLAVVTGVAGLLFPDAGRRGLLLVLGIGGVMIGGSALALSATLTGRNRALEADHARAAAARRTEEEEMEGRLRTHRRHVDDASDGIREILRGIPVRAARVEGDGEGLATALDRLRVALRDAGRIGEALVTEEARIRTFLARLRPVVESVGGIPSEERPGDAPSTRLTPLLARLDEARKRREERARAESAMREMERTLKEAEERLDRAREAIRSFDDGLIVLAPSTADGTPDLVAIEERLRAADEYRKTRGDIEGKHGPLVEVEERIAGFSASDLIEGEKLAELGARVEGIDEELQRRIAEVERLRTMLEGARHVETPDLIESDIERIREEREELRRERDRRELLARIVHVAERDFRERHQPELVRRAEAFLKTLTLGNYDTLFFGSDDDADALQVRGPDLADPLLVGTPLSTGAREQIWFAFRLAVLDLVEGGGESLPLVLDEILVNWDRDRRGAALDTLAELSLTRQIFLVTCHPAFADEARARGARVVTLPGAAGGA